MAPDRPETRAGLAALQLMLEAEHYRALAAEELLGRYLTDRDERAFAVLVHRFGRLVMSRCRQILVREDLAQEAFQEAYTQLVVHGHRVRKRGAVGPWLARTAVRRAMDIAKRERRQREREISVARVESGSDALSAASVRETNCVVMQALSELPEKLRLPIELVYLAGHTHAQAAEALKWPKGTVDSYVRRGLERMKPALTRAGLPAAVIGAIGLDVPVEAVPPDWIARTIVCASDTAARPPAAVAGNLGALKTAAVAVTAVVVGVVSVAVIVALVQNKKTTDPLVTNPPETASVEPPPVPEPSPDDVVLGQVVSIMDKLTGMKTERTMAVQEGPRHFRWRFMWRRDPDKPVRFGSLMSEKAFVDLVFDRWSGKVDMELAADGKTKGNINPVLPINIGPFLIRMPELVELHRAFPRMLMSGLPPGERIGPLHPELVYGVVSPIDDKMLGMARPEPDQGIMIQLNPGETLVTTREHLAGGERTLVLFWLSGQSCHFHEIERGGAPWTHRNVSAVAQDLFIAGICMKDGRWRTCQSRMKSRDDGARVLEFDEEYEGAYDDARVVVKVSK